VKAAIWQWEYEERESELRLHGTLCYYPLVNESTRGLWLSHTVKGRLVTQLRVGDRALLSQVKCVLSVRDP